MVREIKAPRPDDVLMELAGHGDPAAFYSVFAPLLDRTRATIRAAGRSPEQAGEETLQLASRLYREFRGVPGGQSVQDWYDGRTRRHMPAPGTAAAPQRAVPAENGDGARFQERLELLLQREYSARNRSRRRVRLATAVTRPGTWSWPVVAALSVAGTVLLLYLALAVSGTGLTVTLSRKGRDTSVSFLSRPTREAGPAPVTPVVPDTVVARADSTAAPRPVPAAPAAPAVRPSPVPVARTTPVAAPAPATPAARRQPSADTAAGPAPVARVERSRPATPAAPVPAVETPPRTVQPAPERAAVHKDTAKAPDAKREWTATADMAVTGESVPSPAAAAGTTSTVSAEAADATE